MTSEDFESVMIEAGKALEAPVVAQHEEEPNLWFVQFTDVRQFDFTFDEEGERVTIVGRLTAPKLSADILLMAYTKMLVFNSFWEETDGLSLGLAAPLGDPILIYRTSTTNLDSSAVVKITEGLLVQAEQWDIILQSNPEYGDEVEFPSFDELDVSDSGLDREESVLRP